MLMMHASETWVGLLNKQDEHIFATFERKILKTIYGAVK
jgi:hypothetical protein